MTTPFNVFGTLCGPNTVCVGKWGVDSSCGVGQSWCATLTRASQLAQSGQGVVVAIGSYSTSETYPITFADGVSVEGVNMYNVKVSATCTSSAGTAGVMFLIGNNNALSDMSLSLSIPLGADSAGVYAITRFVGTDSLITSTVSDTIQTLSYATQSRIHVNVTACAVHLYRSTSNSLESSWFNVNRASVTLNGPLTTGAGATIGQNGLYGVCVLDSSLAGSGNFYALINELEVYAGGTGNSPNIVGFAGLQAVGTGNYQLTDSNLVVGGSSGCFSYAVETGITGTALTLNNAPLGITGVAPNGNICFGTLSGGTCMEQQTGNNLNWLSPPRQILTFTAINSNVNGVTGTVYVMGPSANLLTFAAAPTLGIGATSSDHGMVCTHIWGYTFGGTCGTGINTVQLYATPYPAGSTTLLATPVMLSYSGASGANTYFNFTTHYTLPPGARYQMRYTTGGGGGTGCEMSWNVECHA